MNKIEQNVLDHLPKSTSPLTDREKHIACLAARLAYTAAIFEFHERLSQKSSVVIQEMIDQNIHTEIPKEE